MADRQDQRLAAILRNGWPEPRAGWEGRVLSAMTAVRPRRHPNLVPILVAILILLLLAAATYAAVRFFVHGNLQFLEVDPWAPPDASREAIRLLSGQLEWVPEYPAHIGEFDVSPSGDRICFYRSDGWMPTEADILTAKSDHSDEVNLTAKLGGINCWPKWSPDGTMIGFNHTDRRPDQMACEAGFQAWVMNADGSEARPIVPESEEPTWFCSWSPHGSRILLGRGAFGTKEANAKRTSGQYPWVTTDLWGRDVRSLPNVGWDPAYSPDGTKIVSTNRKRAVSKGRSGWCNQLTLTNADGSDPKVLVEQFISDTDVLRGTEHEAARGITAVYPRLDMEGSILGFIGPSKPAWSPKGDQIAFLAAMPFDPKGLDFQRQVEVYVYDLASREVIRITHDDLAQRSVNWKPAGKPIVWQHRRTAQIGHTDMSPDGRQKVFQRGNIRLGPGMRRCDIYLADADGSHERNVSKAAGLGGINCRPYWSPDGTMIAFGHVDPVEGRSPCRARHQLWVMNADGSHARRLTPEGSLGFSPGGVRWSPDSTRLLSCWEGKTDPRQLESTVIIAFTVDVRTGKIQVLPNVGRWGQWSPDGSRIASTCTKPDTANGERGKWNQLVLTKADGSNPRVLVQQFISDATTHATTRGYPGTELVQGEPIYDVIDQFWCDVGPRPVVWSLKGEQIAFAAALPYDPNGPSPKEQVEIWVYDLRSNKATHTTRENVERWIGQR